MNAQLSARLNKVLPRISDPAFLSNEGIGNEIACYIFDYRAEEELQVRQHLTWMSERLKTHHADIKALHLNLFDVILDYLKSRKKFDATLQKQAKEGDERVLKALKPMLTAEKIRDFIARTYHPAEYDLILLAGVGSAWPMMRVHGLLNCMHTIIGQTPLVLFYPGSFDGTTLRLFGRLATSTPTPGRKPYYRAFILVPNEA